MTDTEPQTNRRVPTLVQLCQRAAAASVDSIATLGDLSYPLVKPILERCSVDQLSRFEEASPHLQDDTLEIWMQSCIRKYPTAVEKYLDDDTLEPISWKARYMILKQEEERRLEQVGSKLRSQRLEAEERKKEREVKLTDRLPPSKRQRTWGAPAQPKTLLQKTFSEASKIQKAMTTSRILPPMNKGKSYCVLPKPSCSIMPALKSNVPSRVSVNTVAHRRPIIGPSTSLTTKVTPTISSPSSLTRPSPSVCSPSNSRPRFSSDTHTPPTVPVQSGSPSLKVSPAASPSSTSGDVRPLKLVTPVKKDPMASLFVPKRRAHSQRPV